MNHLLAPIALAIILLSCNEKKIEQKAEGEKLMQLSREWSKSASTDDIEKTMSYWADSAIFLSSNHPDLRGKKQIREMVESSSRIPGFQISWEPLSVTISEKGDLAYMIEQTQVSMKDSAGKSFTSSGKVVTIWKKDAGGTWKNVVEASMDGAGQ
jgi:ketosteroid isomerase-like protein